MMNDVERAKFLLELNVFNKSVLADEINKVSEKRGRKFISRSAMVNKCSPTHRDNFSKEQVGDILEYFQEFHKTIAKYIK